MKIRRALPIRSSLFLAAVLLFGARLQSFAVVTPVTVYSSFGPGSSYNTAIVFAIGGATSPSGYRGQAEFFVPGISGNLANINLATLQLSGSKLSNFFIAQDDGSGIPGAILESYLNVQNTANGLLTIVSAAQPLLEAGQKYWFCAEPTADSSYNGWYQNNQGIANGFAIDRSEWNWQFFGPPTASSGVFNVNVTPVPEPSIAGLVFLGAGLFRRRSRNRRR